MIPEGTFSAVARGGTLSESENKKTPQVVVSFEITTAEHAGTTINWFGFLTDKTTERTIESLRYAGWKGSDLSDLSDLSKSDTPVVELVIEHEEYEGKTRPKVQWVNRVGRAGKALPAEQAKTLAARMRGAIAAVDQKLKAQGFSGGGSGVPF
jgi:hypothetical protein